MAEVETLELWVFEKLKQKMGKDPAVVRTESDVAVTLVGGQDVDKFIQISELQVEAVWLSKVEASGFLKAFQRALRELEKENFIISVSIQNENSERSGNPEAWSYMSIVQIRHRRRESWQV